MSNLENKLDELLAADFGVAPNEVNASVEKWHDEHHFPIEKYETESIYGGYNLQHSAMPSEKELQEMKKRTDAFLDRYSELAKT